MDVKEVLQGLVPGGEGRTPWRQRADLRCWVQRDADGNRGSQARLWFHLKSLVSPEQ